MKVTERQEDRGIIETQSRGEMEVQTARTHTSLTKSGPHVLSDSHVTSHMHIFKHKYKHVCHTCTHIHARLAPTLYHTAHTTQSCPSSDLSLSNIWL